MKNKMSIICFAIICLFVLSLNARAEVIFQDNFDSSSNWTVTQPTGSTTSCSTSCGVPGGWTGYYNGACLCDGVPGEPGNNLMYINQYAGYPNETNPCRGGSGKCLSIWDESCISGFDNSDAQITLDLGQEYEELYLRFYIRFKSGWELRALIGQDGPGHKLYHIQHYSDGSPHAYFGANPGNQPVSSGGVTQYGNTIEFYAENRCVGNYYCHGVTVWPLGSTAWAYAAGGIFDGNWHSIELRIKRNSAIGVADGLLELWYDGTKKTLFPGFTNTDYEYTDTGSDLRGWRYVMLGGNNNNQFDSSCSNMADCEQWYAIDDVVVATEYIGPDSLPSPSPPTGLTVLTPN